MVSVAEHLAIAWRLRSGLRVGLRVGSNGGGGTASLPPYAIFVTKSAASQEHLFS